MGIQSLRVQSFGFLASRFGPLFGIPALRAEGLQPFFGF